MFNDERINAECGKIYKRGILLAVLVTLAYALSRTVTLAIQGTLQVVFTYTEFVILLYGGGILLTGVFRFYKDRDERVEFEKHAFCFSWLWLIKRYCSVTKKSPGAKPRLFAFCS